MQHLDSLSDGLDFLNFRVSKLYISGIFSKNFMLFSLYFVFTHGTNKNNLLFNVICPLLYVTPVLIIRYNVTEKHTDPI